MPEKIADQPEPITVEIISASPADWYADQIGQRFVCYRQPNGTLVLAEDVDLHQRHIEPPRLIPWRVINPTDCTVINLLHGKLISIEMHGAGGPGGSASTTDAPQTPAQPCTICGTPHHNPPEAPYCDDCISKAVDEILHKRAEMVEILLKYESAMRKNAAYAVERQQTITLLRRVCADHGDNDWPDNLHLADIIDKHLADYLYQ